MQLKNTKIDNRKIIENGILAIVNKIRKDEWFSAANIHLTKKFDHFVDRVIERKIDPVELISTLKSKIFDNKCLIAYYCHLENKPIRLNFKTDNLVIGITVLNSEKYGFLMTLRTVIPNSANRYDSRVSIFTI